MKRFAFVIMFAATLLCFVPVVSSYTDTMNRKTAVAVFTEIPPVIDGELSDEVWQAASVNGDFRRRDDPDRGGPARVKTFFRVLYDEKYLYIAIEMHGDNPDKLLRSITKRDENLDKDDAVCLYIDTFHDLRSAYFLQVNSIGTQRDLISSGCGNNCDIGWDALWEAKTALINDGWTVEFKIPFKIFRFNWSDDMIWGIDIVRVSVQREEWSEWCYIEDTENNTLDPRLYGDLTGLERVKKPRMLQVITSLVGSQSLHNSDADPYSDEEGWDKEDEVEIGADLIWNVTPKSTLNLTVNPDFAQIEADPDELNLTGEEIFLQERRPFFRENNAIFLVPGSNIPFYTRRIVSIDEGLKFTGQYAGSDYAFLLVHGEDGSKEENYFFTARTQTPLFENFTVSTWFVEKHNPDDLEDYTNSHGEFYSTVENVYNRLLGLDSQYRINNWHMLLSYYNTAYPDETRAWYTDKPTGSRDMLYYKLKYTANHWVASIDYKDLGRGFNPEMGYTTTTHIGSRCVNAYYGHRIPFAEDHLFNYIESYTEAVLSYERKSPGDRNKIGVLTQLDMEFDNYFGLVLQADWIEDKTYERFNDFTTDDDGTIINPTARYFAATLGKGNYNKHLFHASFRWTDGGWKGAGFNYQGGEFYYSRIKQYSVWMNWTFGNSLTLESTLDYLFRYNPTREYLDYFGTWDDQKNWIFRNKITFTGVRNLYVRGILSGYLDEMHFNDQYDLSLLFEYTYLPGSKVYLVYENGWIPYDYINDQHLGLDEVESLRQTIYLKLTYLFDF